MLHTVSTEYEIDSVVGGSDEDWWLLLLEGRLKVRLLIWMYVAVDHVETYFVRTLVACSAILHSIKEELLERDLE